MGRNAKYRHLRATLLALAFKDERWLNLTPSEQKATISRSLRQAKRQDKRAKTR